MFIQELMGSLDLERDIIVSRKLEKLVIIVGNAQTLCRWLVFFRIYEHSKLVVLHYNYFCRSILTKLN